ncbi:hypothetical protein D3P09_21955 [Paenibacillus pinisoli]|uniref:Uncharacterized protein n=1 Tax=Paenibacillus pinisoli TaxID=1276110 RepID=A0A3A6P9M5_9BACL|nr:hypothetical protein [Paenibacillus pinisoli]RJX37642.1 hypothetical protein D3P09_21955 [Paenibacillus pinisoli]
MRGLLWRKLFYQGAKPEFSEAEIKRYRHIYEQALLQQSLELDTEIQVDHFLQYLSQYHQVLFHGSNATDIQEFIPRPQTLYTGQMTEAVFATSDGIWPVFYAIFNRIKLHGNFRNGCIECNNHRYYFFSLSEETCQNDPWCEGAVYVLPRVSFKKQGKGFLVFDEWTSSKPVQPLFHIRVKPSDFAYLHQVSAHRSAESILKTWFMYKSRIKKGSSYTP